MPSPLRPALFLDRDGVINVDRGYVSRIADFEWMPGIFDVARAARELGLPVVVVTNQSGIGRGYYSEDDFLALMAFVRERFSSEGAPLTAVYHCPFHPDAIEERFRDPDHSWRKPRPGMLLAAGDDLGIDLPRSIMLGDRIVDLQAGAAAGIRTLALIGEARAIGADVPPHHRFLDLSGVPQWLEKIGRGAASSR